LRIERRMRGRSEVVVVVVVGGVLGFGRRGRGVGEVRGLVGSLWWWWEREEKAASSSAPPPDAAQNFMYRSTILV
jgi:hypothetical protein